MSVTDTLFSVELPFVETNEELEKVKQLYPTLDPYFIASGCIQERRAKFDALWKDFKPYADRHFLKQMQINFHQRSWEMYVTNVLLKNEFQISSQNEGPDLIVNDDVYMECIAPTKGDAGKPDSVPPMHVVTNQAEMVVQGVPTDKMILRITQSFKEKTLAQYNKWKNKDWFDPKSPFVIAINTGDLEHVEDPNMPNVLKALFGFQFLQINIKNGATSFSYRDQVDKSNRAPVAVNIFLDSNFSFVSGVLFSSDLVLNHPENIRDDCIFVNNPFADNQVDKSFIRPFKSWTANKEDNEVRLTKNH